MLKTYFSVVIALGFVTILTVTGCKSEEDFRIERANNARLHFEMAQFKELAQDTRLTLPECIRLAHENNLDAKVYKLEEAVAREMRTAEVLGMLPEININNNFTGRSNTPASSSKAYKAGGATYGASTSSDRNINAFNIDFALSVMDFGLAFFNSQQAHDRYLMRQQRSERVSQNLTLDVVRVYFQVAAAQRAINITRGLLDTCRDRYTLIKRLSDAKKITPFRAFDETSRFIEMERRLTGYILDYQNACIELRSQLGYYPTANITVDDSVLAKVPEFKFPEMEVMEQIALMKRPELYEIDMQKHINVVECRKVLLSMFPSARLFADYNNNNNSFLYKQNWWELGIQSAFNLLKVPQKIGEYMSYQAQVEAEQVRSYGQAITVMAQVRIAHADILANKEILDTNIRTFENYNTHLTNSLKNQQITGDLPRLELDHIRLTTAESDIQRIMSLGNYYVSYYRLLNAIGIRSMTDNDLKALTEELNAAQGEAKKEIAKAEQK